MTLLFKLYNRMSMNFLYDVIQGMKRFDAREKVAQSLQKMGLWRGQDSHAMTVPVCSRSNDIVEPRLKEQWFLDCSDMAHEAMMVSVLDVSSVFVERNSLYCEICYNVYI